MSECASKYNSRAEEAIYSLAKLLERQTGISDSRVDDFNELLDDHDKVVAELAEVEALVVELKDDNMQLQYQVIDAVEQRDAAIQRLGALDALHAHELRRAQGLEDELREANEFLTRLADLAADEDWLAIAQAFGLAKGSHPEYLETEADYESAPVGTVVAYWHKDPDIIEPGFKRADRGWRYVELSLADYDELSSAAVAWSGHPRKVLQWGAQ